MRLGFRLTRPHFRWSGVIAAACATLVLSAAALGALAAQSLEDAEFVELYEGETSGMSPIPCKPIMTTSGTFQGVWFYNVRFIKRGGTGNVASYDTYTDPTISADGDWEWWEGGGTFTCHRINLVFTIYIDIVKLINYSYGYLLPRSGGGGGGGEGEGGGGEPAASSTGYTGGGQGNCTFGVWVDGSYVGNYNWCNEAWD